MHQIFSVINLLKPKGPATTKKLQKYDSWVKRTTMLSQYTKAVLFFKKKLLQTELKHAPQFQKEAICIRKLQLLYKIC